MHRRTRILAGHPSSRRARFTPGAVTAVIATLALLGGCHEDRSEPASAGKQTQAVAPARAPVRGAAGDADLRVMLAEIASAKACEQIRGHFQALPANGRPKVTSGALWIHGCRISNTGTKVKFRLAGHGWQWVDEEKKKAGATFVLHQYVRFGVAATVSGTLDVGYDPASHVASVWFSLTDEPQVQFTPVGKIDVDAEGAWSSVLSAAASLLANSPEKSAKEDAQEQGATEFKKQFADGISVTVDLCTGLSRSGIGHTPRGKMAAPGVGETRELAVELQPGGLLAFGPQPASAGMTAEAEVTAGSAHLSLVCNDQAEALAKAFVEDQPPPRVARLAVQDLHGKGSLHTGPVACPVSLIAQAAPGSSAPVVFTWRRPVAETTKAAGGPLIDCPDRAGAAPAEPAPSSR